MTHKIRTKPIVLRDEEKNRYQNKEKKKIQVFAM